MFFTGYICELLQTTRNNHNLNDLTADAVAPFTNQSAPCFPNSVHVLTRCFHTETSEALKLRLIGPHVQAKVKVKVQVKGKVR